MMNTYLYIHPGLRSVSLFQDSALPEMTERHHFRLPVLSLKETSSLVSEIDSANAAGVVFGVEKGLRTGASFDWLGMRCGAGAPSTSTGRSRTPSRWWTPRGCPASGGIGLLMWGSTACAG